MTEKQLKYQLLAKRSRVLCADMEKLIEDADYQEKLLNYDSREILVMQVIDIKLQLETIWDEQVNLFFDIRDEIKLKKRTAVMEQVKAISSRKSTKMISQRDY